MLGSLDSSVGEDGSFIQNIYDKKFEGSLGLKF